MIDKNFMALVHYISEQCIEAPISLGKRKLNKILWNSEVAAYSLLGEALTSETYIRRQFGPACANTEMALLALQNEGRVLVRRRKHAGHPRFLILSLREVEHPFDHDQINLVDHIIDWVVHDHVASAVRIFSENNTWQTIEIGQEVPHHTIFSISRAEITERDLPGAKPTGSRSTLSLVE